MSGSYGRRATQQERLAQLSDDNAFVDVEAALRRMGQDVSLDTSGQQQRSAKSFMPHDAPGTAGTTKGSAGKSGVKRSFSHGGLRPSAEALLSGARVPLTASLQEQHRAYMDSVHAAAAQVEASSSSSSSTISSGMSSRGSSCSASRLNSGDEDECDADGDAVSGGGTGVRRTGQQAGGQSRRSTAVPPRRGQTRKVEQEVSLAAASFNAPVVALSVRAVKAEPAGGTSTAVMARKRGREEEEDDNAQAVKQEDTSSGAQATTAEATTACDHLSRSRDQHQQQQQQHSDADAGLSVTASLVGKLSSELRLVEQWRRVMLDHPPLMINNVLSPQARAPWTARKGAATPAAGGADPKTSEKPPSASADGFVLEKEHVFGEPELPYPLLQLYALCPSYEALAAAPVRRRGLERVPCLDKDEEGEAVVPLSLLTATADGTRAFASALRRTPKHTAAAEAVSVAGVPFALPTRTRSSRRRRGKQSAARGRNAIGAGVEGATDGCTSIVSAPTCEEGVQGTCHHHLCSVCMLPASYRCLRCRTALFCSVECHVLHDATRCLKFTL